MCCDEGVVYGVLLAALHDLDGLNREEVHKNWANGGCGGAVYGEEFSIAVAPGVMGSWFCVS